MHDALSSLSTNSFALAVGNNFPTLSETLVYLSGNIPLADAVTGILFLFTLLLVVFLGITAAVYYMQIAKNVKPTIAAVEMFRRIYNILAIVAAFTAANLAIFRGADLLMWIVLGFATLLFLGYPAVNYRYVSSLLPRKPSIAEDYGRGISTLFTPRQFFMFFCSLLIAPVAILVIGDIKISFFVVFVVQLILVYFAI